MKTEDRKATIAAYKERKAVAGIYLIRCAASGERWAGRALDLATIGNRVWFTLRHGTHTDPVLQAAWRAHGPDGFACEAVERLEEEALAYVRNRILKQRLAHWCATLDARPI